MSNGLKLTSEDGKKEFHITASGPVDAKVVFPNQSDYPMVPLEETKPLLAQFLFNNHEAFLDKTPTIKYIGKSSDTNVINNDTYITSNIVTSLGGSGKPLNEYEGILWQVSRDNLFNTDVYEYPISGTDIENKIYPNRYLDLDASKIVELGLVGELINDGGKTLYHTRFRYFQEGKPSLWSNVISFIIDGNFYNAPSITTELEYDKSIESLSSIHNRYPLTGGVIVNHGEYSVKLGKLEEPEFINVYIGRNLKQGEEAPIYFKVPYKSGSIVVYPELLGNGDVSVFNLQPNVPFNLYITYEGKDVNDNYVTSEPSNLVTNIVFPNPCLFPVDFKLLQGSSKVSAVPTLAIEDIITDYNYLVTYASYKRERLSYIENNPGRTEAPLEMNLVIDVTDARDNPVTKITKTINIIDIKTNESLGQYITLERNILKAGREYNFNLSISFVRKGTISSPPKGSYDYIIPLPFDKVVLSKVRMKTTDNVATDNFTRPKATQPSSSSSPKFNAYYGEIVKEGDYGLMPDINYRGNLKANTIYYLYDEVVIEDKLYIVIKNQYSTASLENFTIDPNVFVEVTSSNHKAIYKSGLPTYEWLAKRIGVPYKKTVYVDKEGNIDKGEPITRILNDDSGWIKCANYAKQHIYIAKRPIVSNISYRELQRRFLTGEYSRTIRIGLNYFSVRLLEVGPTSTIDPIWKTKNNVDNDSNYQNELELYQQLFRVAFGSYQPDDLGLDNDIKSKTFIAKGVVNTSTSLDNNKNIVTTAKPEEYTEEDLDNRDYTYYYRPVLELIRYDNLPLLKSKELPGSLNCTYDKWSDTGYYGVVGVTSFMTPEEIKTVYNLPYLQVTKEPIVYHKFYYHGLTVYVPNKPIGMISKEDIKLFNKSGLIYGTDTESYLFRGSKYVMTLPNLYPSYYTDKTYVNNNDSYVTSKEVLQHLHDDSILGGLINRISNLFKGLIPSDEHKPAHYFNFVKDTEVTLDPSINSGILLKDLILDKNLLDEETILDHYSFAKFKNGRVLSGTDPEDKTEYDTSLNIWPVFITETADYSKDFSYPSLTSPVPKITYEKKKVIKYELQPKKVKRERRVQKTKTEKYQVEVIVERPIITGRHKYNDVPVEHPNVGINLAFTYAKKTDRAYFQDLLYSRYMLNVKHIDNDYIVRWSSRFRTLDEYLLESFILPSTKQGFRIPMPMNKKLEDTREFKTYLKSLVHEDIEIGTLTNHNYERIHSLDNKYPLGMFYGTVSSKELVFPIPRWYKLYEDDKKQMNKYPMILKDPDGNWTNDFSYVTTNTGERIPIPLMNSYLPYEDYSSYGKTNVIEPIVTYLTNITYNDRIDLQNIDELKQTIRDEYVFGLLGIELRTSKVLEGSINEGKAGNPKLISMDGNLPEYLSLYKTVKDIFNPVEDARKESIVTTEWREREIIYYELEEYEVTVYEEVRVEKEITVPVIKYE